jgi:hypothetical protein
MNIRILELVAMFGLMVCLTLPCVAQQGQERVEPRVSVAAVPSAIVLYREVTGPYDQHPEVFADLMRYVGANYRAVGACFGVYPQDPDSVQAKQLHWEVGVRVVPGKPLRHGNNLPIEKLPVWSDRKLEGALQKMKHPHSPYRLKLQAKTNAAVVDSTVANAAQDGLAMFPWMAKNGYVQIAPHQNGISFA